MKRIVVIVLFTIFYGYSVERCAVCLGDYPKEDFALEKYNRVCLEHSGSSKFSKVCSNCINRSILEGNETCPLCRRVLVGPPKCWNRDCLIACSICLTCAVYTYHLNDPFKEYEELYGECPLCYKWSSGYVQIRDGIYNKSCYANRNCQMPQFEQVCQLKFDYDCRERNESQNVPDVCHFISCVCACLACSACLGWWIEQGSQYCDEVAMPEIKDRIRKGREYIGAIVQQPRALMEGREHRD